MQSVFFCAAILALVLGVHSAASNNRPVIGILTQPTSGNLAKYGEKYIAASYVKYVEAGGARVAPVQHDASEDELNDYFNNLNGILFPGGDSDLVNTTLYFAAKYFYDRSLEAFDNGGDIFPVMGHCQGFELLSIITSNNFDILSPVDAQNISLPLEFTSAAPKSTLFGENFPDDLGDIYITQNVTFNNHQFALLVDTFSNDKDLNTFYNSLSENDDRNGTRFVSTMEGIKYPIYGIQWHAEKPLYEWNSNEDINHHGDAISAMQYMSNTFVFLARASKHSFPSAKAEQSAVIYNYKPVYTYDDDPDFEQCYFF
jgi:gamma-glutamyl hydrolase